jgi:tRNA G18 (ribose-2'-O)-methylase SpoU
VGQAASVASFLPLMQVSPRPSFCVFLEGFSLLEGEELLVDNLPCLHVVGKNPSKATERLVQQFGGEVSARISPTGKASMNRIGKFLVAQKKALRLNPQDVNVLTLQNQLFLAEQQAAHLVAQQIAENPPKALMAVISPKNVGGFSGGKRRAPGEEGGGAPCPSEFLLQRERRTTDPKGPSREHPSRQQQSQELETQQSSSETTPGEDFAITVLIENPSKGNNLGPLLRCCSAFRITRIFTVGYDQCAVSGSHGASKHVELVAFPTIETAVRHLVDEEGFELIGLLQGVSQLGDSDVGQDSCPVYKEAVDAARTGSNSSYHSEDIVHVATTASKESAPIANRFSAPAHLRKFSPRTCLVVDKKSRGLPWTMARHCRSFIHVPHFPSINTKQAVTIEACLSIVLYEFTTWAGLDDQSYKGQKYHVKRIQKGSHGDAELLEKKRLERQQKMDTRQAEADDLMVAATSSIFAQGPARHDGDY